MSIRPIDVMMSITQSQNLKSPESDHSLKHAQQSQMLTDQNIKAKESVIKIPDDENDTEVMDTIKQGMTDGHAEDHLDSSHPKHQEKEISEKELLDEANGHSIDIMG